MPSNPSENEYSRAGEAPNDHLKRNGSKGWLQVADRNGLDWPFDTCAFRASGARWNGRFLRYLGEPIPFSSRR